MGYIVAIVGRPNVGKSTLFNRLTETRSAIVDDSSGTTRDRHYGKCEWNGHEFSVIDTGGYVTNSDDIFESEIRKQVKLAIDEADTIIFMVDVANGITDLDGAVANMLRKSKKRVLLVVNKVDNSEQSFYANEFYAMGIGEEIYSISSMTGSGTGDMLDAITNSFEGVATVEEDSKLPKFTVAGRPNVGKSSFINALIGEERNIVTPIAGTTRDTLHTRYNKFGMDFVMIDTAGLRKKGKVTEDIEFYSVIRSIRAIESSDVVFLMLDATQGIEMQDVNIFHIACRNNKGVVILVNKWDIMEKDHKTTLEFEKRIKERIAPFVDVPIIFVSAMTKQRIFKALEIGMEVFENKKRRITTSELNELMLAEIEKFPPPGIKGKYVKIKYVTQLPTVYPTFAFFCNLPQYVKDPYKRFLENRLRDNYKFSGVPISIFMRQK